MNKYGSWKSVLAIKKLSYSLRNIQLSEYKDVKCEVERLVWHLVSVRTYGVMYDHTLFLCMQSHEIRHKATCKLSCQPGDCRLSIFLRGLCGYVQVNILYRPQGFEWLVWQTQDLRVWSFIPTAIMCRSVRKTSHSKSNKYLKPRSE